MYRTPKADQFNISDLRAAADIVEEKNSLLTYLGFCKPGTENTAAPQWSILRIQQTSTNTPNTVTFMWADGLCSFNLVWDNRANYNYSFKKF